MKPDERLRQQRLTLAQQVGQTIAAAAPQAILEHYLQRHPTKQERRLQDTPANRAWTNALYAIRETVKDPPSIEALESAHFEMIADREEEAFMAGLTAGLGVKDGGAR